MTSTDPNREPLGRPSIRNEATTSNVGIVALVVLVILVLAVGLMTYSSDGPVQQSAPTATTQENTTTPDPATPAPPATTGTDQQQVTPPATNPPAPGTPSNNP